MELTPKSLGLAAALGALTGLLVIAASILIDLPNPSTDNLTPHETSKLSY